MQKIISVLNTKKAMVIIVTSLFVMVAIKTALLLFGGVLNEEVYPDAMLFWPRDPVYWAAKRWNELSISVKIGWVVREASINTLVRQFSVVYSGIIITLLMVRYLTEGTENAER